MSAVLDRNGRAPRGRAAWDELRKPKSRSLGLAMVLILLASGARAQFAPLGGYAPFTFNAPEAEGANAYTGAAGAEICTREYRGRSGLQIQCAAPAPQPARQAESQGAKGKP